MLPDLLAIAATALAVLSPPASPPPPIPPKPVTAPPTAPEPAPEPPTMQVESSAYCIHGKTASGRPAGPGIAASNALYGRRVRIVDGPLAGTTWEVADRHARRYRRLLDVWLPCTEAVRYGRRTVVVTLEG